MRKAIELSQQAVEKNQGGPFGAVIVKDGKIVGQGHNQVTSSNDPTAHAEIVAIRNACKNINSFQLGRLHYLYFLRALPDVSRSYLLGKAKKNILCLHQRRCC